ncbi:MAG: hypothetical protein AB4368_13160 [Xenococcaceae cyanobacterium]
MSKNKDNYSIGYEALRDDFEKAKKECPKGITIRRTGQTIAYQFQLLGSRRNRASGCTFTLDGIYEALKKSRLIVEKLKTVKTKSEFDEWYDGVILEKNTIEDDSITFKQAIAKVENDFWTRPSRTGRKRSKVHPSDNSSWKRTYGDFYRYLPQSKILNLKDILTVIERWGKGTKNYGMAIGAMKKLARLNRDKAIVDELNELNTSQTVFNKRQTVDLNKFLEWRDRTLGITEELHPLANLDTRKRWLWAFSIQIVYGLRIHEVFAIENLEQVFKTEDGETIPALSDTGNTDNILIVGTETRLGTSTKTGYRLARPFIPPSYPDLIEKLKIKTPMLPINKPRKNSSLETSRTFYSKTARDYLIQWNAPFTQTHAERHLANLHGIQAGIPIEVRSQSLGHTPEMNERTYKKRQHTKETLNILLQSNQSAIDFVSALNIAKKLVKTYPNSYQPITELLAKIYGKNEDDVMELL